jgi:hypothetical protein
VVVSDPTIAGSCFAGPVAANGGTCIIPVQFKPVAGKATTPATGAYADTLTVKATILPAGATLAVAVPIAGVPLSANDIQQITYTVPTGFGTFPATGPGKSSTAQVITILNNTDQTVSGITASSNLAVFSVTNGCATAPLAGKTCTVSVELKVPTGTAAGTNYSGTLTVTDPLNGASTYTLTGSVN